MWIYIPVVLSAEFASSILDIVHTFVTPCFSFCFFSLHFYSFSISLVISIAAVYKQPFSLYNQVNNEICTASVLNINVISRASRFTWFTRFTIDSIITWFTILSRCSTITRNASTRFTTRTWTARPTRWARIAWFTGATWGAFEGTGWWASTTIPDSCITTFITRWSLRSWVSRGTIISRYSRSTIFTISTFETIISLLSL